MSRQCWLSRACVVLPYTSSSFVAFFSDQALFKYISSGRFGEKVTRKFHRYLGWQFCFFTLINTLPTVFVCGGKIMQAVRKMASNVYKAPALTFELLSKCSVR